MTQISQAEKLFALRAVLKEEGVEGFIIPRADEYQGEYVPASADRLRWISGFTGSAGMTIVLDNKAVVMSDGRYTIQLKQQIDPGLFETADSVKTPPSEWLAANAKGKTVGYDPRLHTPAEIRKFAEKGVSLKPLGKNPLDAVWKDRPAAPSAQVEMFPIEFAGVSAQDKLDAIAARIEEKACYAAVITLPDSIAWMLNIRSTDIPHIPVALSYAIARKDGTLDWFIDEGRVPDEVRASFGNRVSFLPTDALERSLAELNGKRVMVDERRSSVWFSETLKKHGAEIIDAKDPAIALKARKNKTEQAAMRNAHVRDGVAVTKFLKWIEKAALRETLTEIDAERKLEEFRREGAGYRDSSFDTIAGFGPNGAIVHYRASEETNRTLEKWNLLLLDSGAQYSDGTTDITRTIAIGNPSDEMRDNYTIVLKGHIAVASAKFPKGTTGAQIDALARAPLWQHNLDYAHGTGHGVGCYLSVHEEAASLSPRGHDIVEDGMILSNEPGYYKEGEYGIRIENLILAHEDGFCSATGKPMLMFETLTFAPFDRHLINPALLSADEKFWLANYHKTVFAELSPYLDDETKSWLYDQTHG
jgi:Xaa-Pro aminopeptidase